MNTAINAQPKGEFVSLGGERYYAIYDVDKMPPFFVSLISPDDHWLFVSSTGGLTAGRVSPETALFPYVPVDRIHESNLHTGPKTLVRVVKADQVNVWEPFNAEHYGKFQVVRNLYRTTLGNKIAFEEVNQDLGLTFRYTWETSSEFGFSRHCELINNGSDPANVAVLDGLQNILPAGTPRFTQTNSSNLVDAYKWTELTGEDGLAMYTLYSGITDRAAPCESLDANICFPLGLENYEVILDASQIHRFRAGLALEPKQYTRGIRGAYLVNFAAVLAPAANQDWRIVTDIDLSQAKVVDKIQALASDADGLQQRLIASINDGSDRLARIMAASDGFQATAEEAVYQHHYANALYNVLRGGIFDQQYLVTRDDLVKTIKMFNAGVYQANQDFLNGLAETLQYSELLAAATVNGDPQLQRLIQEYLPITFGRRHGDPSRPWNQFAINLKDEQGNSLLSYQGNWRDIFQNWEALSWSFPEFIDGMVAKFVNASTVDGYNPYRITKQGIDWEVEEPDDPWSYIGYWGDHQIIYLLKLLEVANQFSPSKLDELLHSDIFCYANVPYRIKPFEQLLQDAKDTVYYDDDLSELIDQRVADMGSDGKMLLDADGKVYQVNLLEKLVVPLLAKLGNLVLDGGIWLNTQRPEWNDANNALVGQGLSMVTLYYMRRYVAFMQDLLKSETGDFNLSSEIATWLDSTAGVLADLKPKLKGEKVTASLRFTVLQALGMASSHYRDSVYKAGFSGKTATAVSKLTTMLDDAMVAIDHCIATNRADNGLYHAYNLLKTDGQECHVDNLYPMLEGQVSALSTGNVAPELAVDVLEKLFDSDIYRADQDTFMLYPDRAQVPFLDKNKIPADKAKQIPLFASMLADGDTRLLQQDPSGDLRFNSSIVNGADLADRIDAISSDIDASEKQAALDLYESVFNHQAFTGRSGGMFGFEGLGCIYWHMVSKLLLATGENFFNAVESDADAELASRLGYLYYRVRAGIGFNKTPAQYGAFPTDPYSHTPKHAGAQQPGMTGQVKEELIARFMELGIRVAGGEVSFKPALLRAQEFSTAEHTFCYLDVAEQWQTLDLPSGSLGFTWCQTPIVYQLSDTGGSQITLHWQDGSQTSREALRLASDEAQHLFSRDGKLQRIEITLSTDQLLLGA